MVIIQKGIDMGDWKDLYQKGNRYYKNANAFFIAEHFSVQLSVNMIGMAAEYLIGSVKAKYNIIALHNNISSHLKAISSELKIDDELMLGLKQIEIYSSFCGDGKVTNPTHKNVEQMLLTLDELHAWVDNTLNICCDNVVNSN